MTCDRCGREGADDGKWIHTHACPSNGIDQQSPEQLRDLLDAAKREIERRGERLRATEALLRNAEGKIGAAWEAVPDDAPTDSLAGAIEWLDTEREAQRILGAAEGRREVMDVFQAVIDEADWPVDVPSILVALRAAWTV